ncbi:MAG: hypothetical protein AB4426_03330, partial [Xenococcaceae cyanobacterium]
GHYGPTLMSFTLYQHHQCRVPQNLILEQRPELGVDISAGQVNHLLVEDKESFHTEQSQVLHAGLETAEYIHTLRHRSSTSRAEWILHSHRQ